MVHCSNYGKVHITVTNGGFAGVSAGFPMSDTHTYSSDVAFTPAVKAIQTRKGSRDGYADVEARGGWRAEIDEKLAAFVAEANSMFLATASSDGQPYIQHRGGPKGFVKVLDKNTLAFADYSGNRQFITQGNLSENPKAHIFLMDYAHRRRVKIWGEARAGHPVQDFGMGHQLSAAHPAEIRRRRCGDGVGRARCAHRRAGNGTGEGQKRGIGDGLIALKLARCKRPYPRRIRQPLARPAALAVPIRRIGRGSPPRTMRRW